MRVQRRETEVQVITMYQALQEKLVSSCPGLVEEVGIDPPDKVQRGLVTHLRSNSCCMAEPGPRPTSVCHQILSSYQDRLGGPSSLIAQCLPSLLQVGSPRTTSAITSHRFQLPDPSSAPPPMQVPDPITPGLSYGGSL